MGAAGPGFNPSPNPALYKEYPQAYISMGETAENLAKKYQISRVKQEAFEHSQVMDTLSFLTDVYGPRLTASPTPAARPRRWPLACGWAG